MIPFVKMQAVGNDFVLIDDETAPAELPDLARRACDRHLGIGADGLLVVGASPNADLWMRIFNADGSEDTMCGNGLRCAVRYATERRHAPRTGVVQTLAGAVPYTFLSDNLLQIDLGAPRFAPEDVPFHRPLPAWADGAVNTGSTHTVRFVDALPDDTTFQTLSPQFERDPAFPERTSVLWTRVDGPSRLCLRIWERGVGETLGCGTGAVAAAVIALDSGRIREDEPVCIASPGGELLVEWDRKATGRTFLIGGSSFIFQGVLE